MKPLWAIVKNTEDEPIRRSSAAANAVKAYLTRDKALTCLLRDVKKEEIDDYKLVKYVAVEEHLNIPRDVK